MTQEIKKLKTTEELLQWQIVSIRGANLQVVAIR
ncbi:hypothetical protein NUACC26_041930 [Scytonema sp. NUACC26]